MYQTSSSTFDSDQQTIAWLGFRRVCFACCLSLLVLVSVVSQPVYAIDFIAPRIDHPGVETPIKPGDNQLITAKVTDDARVEAVTLHYRERGTRDFVPVPMSNLDGSDHYEANVISGIESSGIEYFFEATDSSGNTLEMYGSDGKPFNVAVVTQQVSVVNNVNIKVPNAGRNELRKKSRESVLPIKKEKSGNRWLWVGLGVLAAAVVAGAGGGGDSPPDGGDNTGDLDITTPVPAN